MRVPKTYHGTYVQEFAFRSAYFLSELKSKAENGQRSFKNNLGGGYWYVSFSVNIKFCQQLDSDVGNKSIQIGPSNGPKLTLPENDIWSDLHELNTPTPFTKYGNTCFDLWGWHAHTLQGGNVSQESHLAIFGRYLWSRPHVQKQDSATVAKHGSANSIWTQLWNPKLYPVSCVNIWLNLH